MVCADCCMILCSMTDSIYRLVDYQTRSSLPVYLFLNHVLFYLFQYVLGMELLSE